MSFTLHIDPLSVPADDVSGSRSEFSGLSLLARIWMWLSQIWGRDTFTDAAESVFCLGPNDTLNGHRFQNLISTDGLGRRERRMLARYDRLGLSYAQVKAWMKARIKRQKFQTALLRYYSLAFFRSKAHQASRICPHDMRMGDTCKAPLSPD